MKFIEVDNATDARIVISQVRGADGRALTFEPKQQKVPVPQTCLSHPALIPYLRSVPPKLVPRTVAEVPAPAPKPMPKPPIAAPAPAPKEEAPAPPPAPDPEPPAPAPAEAPAPEAETPAPESISEAIEEHAAGEAPASKPAKKKKR